MYLNATTKEGYVQISIRLTLTLDVFKWQWENFIKMVIRWLTLTLDVFKFYTTT